MTTSRRRCYREKEAQDRRKRNLRPGNRLSPFFNQYHIVAPDDYETDTEPVVTSETRSFIQTRVTRQKFDDDEITFAFLRKLKNPQFHQNSINFDHK